MKKRNPFAAWQHRETERWLEEMAREGYVLTGTSFGRFVFEQTAMQNLSYLIVPDEKEEESMQNQGFQIVRSGYTFVTNMAYAKVYVMDASETNDEQLIDVRQNIQMLHSVHIRKRMLVQCGLFILMLGMFYLQLPTEPTWIYLFSEMDVLALLPLLIAIFTVYDVISSYVYVTFRWNLEPRILRQFGGMILYCALAFALFLWFGSVYISGQLLKQPPDVVQLSTLGTPGQYSIEQSHEAKWMPLVPVYYANKQFGGRGTETFEHIETDVYELRTDWMANKWVDELVKKHALNNQTDAMDERFDALKIESNGNEVRLIMRQGLRVTYVRTAGVSKRKLIEELAKLK
ncbi:MAG: DUF2812 domain-containing protein [Bacilli bacterium]